MQVSTLMSFLAFTACVLETSQIVWCDDLVEASPDIESLIDELQNLNDEGMGYSSTQTGGAFLPLGESEFYMGMLGPPAPQASDTMRAVISRGAEAIPYLIEHLDDDRLTGIAPPRGMLHFPDEYDVNRRTTQRPEMQIPDFFNRSRTPRQHTITVGDLCFVALGQIVNRHFNAVRYQPTMVVMVNSPTRSEQLLDAVRDEWAGLTPDGHRASLIRDFLEPDYEGRLIGATLRIGYYYPELLEPLAVMQLSRSRYNVYVLDDIVRDQLYAVGSTDERHEVFDNTIQQHGDVMGEAIRQKLFDDLDSPLDELTVRRCLVELFGYSEDVDASARPRSLPTSDHFQGQFIETLTLFPTERIDAAVRELMHAADDEYFALSCSAYLIGRGGDADIRTYVDERWEDADEDRRENLQLLLDRIGWTPLHLAAHDRNAFRATRLIDEGADVDAQAANGQTPLHVAASSGSLHVTKVLLDHEADRNVRDAEGRNSLDLARDESIIQLLRAGTLEGATIFSTITSGQDDLLSALLEADPSLVSSTLGWRNFTPLHLAARHDNAACCRVLLEHGADVNAVDNRGYTPLHIAACYCGVETVELLLTHGADASLRNTSDKTPYDFAVEYSNEAAIEALSE